VGLQGHGVTAAAILFFVGSVGITAWLWPRVAATGWPRWLARIGLVMACQLAAVLLAAVAVNDYFDFYNSWGDLLGSAGNGAPLSVRTLDYGPDAGHQSRHLAALEVDRRYDRPERRPGHTDDLTIGGGASHLSGEALVYLPPQYDDARYARTRFPMVVVLAGYPGHIGTLVHNLEVPRTMNTLLQRGRVRPMVLVMVSPTVVPPRDTECTDVPGGPQVETWLTQDVPDTVARQYRVTPPGSWGMLGVSTGGFCAVKLAMRHPDRFCCTVGMSGYLHAITDFTTGDLFHHDDALRNANDPLWRLAHLPPPATNVLLTVSRAERLLYQQSLQFVAEARPPLHVATITVPSGGHNFGVWVHQLPTCLQWLSLVLPGGPAERRPDHRGPPAPLRGADAAA
jgi:enterochelin esterase-like enzyme